MLEASDCRQAMALIAENADDLGLILLDLHLLTDLLEAEGYRVASAPEGEAALALAVAEPPDLLVADLWMPRLVALPPWRPG